MDKDVIGNALSDYFNEDYTEDIVVISSISEDDIIPVPYLFRSEKELPKLEKIALNLCKSKVLDVGAGAGCHSLILQKRDVDVTAIDTSIGAVNVMKRRGIKADQISFYDVDGEYDTLLLLMNGVGISGTLEGLTFFLQKAKTLLTIDGQILLDSSDIKYMFEEEDGSTWMDLNSSYYGEVTYQMKYKDLLSDKFDWLFVDFEKLKTVASSLGLKTELLYEDENNQFLVRISR